MQVKHLHIVSFNIPYPADYGGVIDVFHKLRTLHAEGIKIILHCFEYGRIEAPELLQYCERVYYYKRKTGILRQFHYLPYIVSTRSSEELIQNLLKDEYPILFEGLHTCYALSDKRLQHRLKIYRESNIEHQYYFHLFKAEKSIRDKVFFLVESLRLYFFQKQLQHANKMLVVSESDTNYLKKHFPNKDIQFLPSFIPNDDININTGRGEYALYHGDLSVAENYNAAKFLIDDVFSGIETPFIIAGHNPPAFLMEKALKYKHIHIIPNPDSGRMSELLHNAHVNVLYTKQATGLKLKLLNALYNGRFCLVNDKMLSGTYLHELCETGNTAEEMRQKLKELFTKEFSAQDIETRRKVLSANYSNKEKAKKLIQCIFGSL